MNRSKRKALMKTFVISQFNYCSLVWMFHNRKLSHRINSIHERALRVTYQDYQSTFLQLLQKDNSVTIHQRNLQVLATMVPFYGWGSTASRLGPLWGGSLLFTTKLPEILGTHFIDLGMMKGWVDLRATQWFWTGDPWIGNPAPYYFSFL